MPKIADYFKPNRITLKREAGDLSTTIAELAVFTEFEVPHPRDTDAACAAISTIASHMAYETVQHELDYHGSSWITFRDGSGISIEGSAK